MKVLKIIIVIIIVGIILLVAFWTWVYATDRATMQEVQSMTAYLENYYQEHREYPSEENFHEQSPSWALSDWGNNYFYRFDPREPTCFTLQYPMGAIRSFAIGERQISPFTGTTYAYRISSCR